MTNWVESYLERNPDAARLPIAARSRYGLHLQRKGRGRLGLFTGAPMHYFVPAKREWVALDTRLQQLGNGEYGVPGLPFRLGADGDVKLLGTSHRHKVWRVGLMTKGRFIETARFGEVRANADRLVRETGIYKHETILLPRGLREELTLTEKPDLDAPDGALFVMESLVPNGGFPDGWVGEHGQDIARFPLGWAQDAQGIRTPVMRWTVTEGPIQKIYTGVPVEWLATATYPVLIDPDVEITGDTADGSIEGSSSSTSTLYDTTSSSFNVGGRTFGGYPHLWRGYLKFDTSSLGPSAEVELVNLKVFPASINTYVGWTIYVRQYDWSANDPLSNANRESAWDGLYSVSNSALLATSSNPAGVHVTSQNLPNSWIAIEGNTFYGLWCNQESYAFPANQGGLHQYSSGNNVTPIERPLLIIEYLAGYPRSGPISLRASLPSHQASLVDTRIKLRARARLTSLTAAIRRENE